MQFRISLASPLCNLPAIEAALYAADPAAGVDLVRAGTQLRVASVLDAPQLRRLLAGVGIDVDPAQVESVPSECCGGCGG